MVTLTLFCLVVNLYLLLKEFYCGFKLKIRRCYNRRQAKKAKTLALARKKDGREVQTKG